MADAPTTPTDFWGSFTSGLNDLVNVGGKAANVISGFSDSAAARKINEMQAAPPPAPVPSNASLTSAGSVAATIKNNALTIGLVAVAIGAGVWVIKKAF